jgi:hypothetical protein
LTRDRKRNGEIVSSGREVDEAVAMDHRPVLTVLRRLD